MGRIDSGEYIIRRVPPGAPNFDTVIDASNGGQRATSGSLRLRDNEVGLSCSRLNITTPIELLKQAGKSVEEGWMVCIWRVGDLPDDLEAISTPSNPPELDPGHCEIRAKAGKIYDQRLASKLARNSRILTKQEIQEMQN